MAKINTYVVDSVMEFEGCRNDLILDFAENQGKRGYSEKVLQEALAAYLGINKESGWLPEKKIDCNAEGLTIRKSGYQVYKAPNGFYIGGFVLNAGVFWEPGQGGRDIALFHPTGNPDYPGEIDYRDIVVFNDPNGLFDVSRANAILWLNEQSDILKSVIDEGEIGDSSPVTEEEILQTLQNLAKLRLWITETIEPVFSTLSWPEIVALDFESLGVIADTAEDTEDEEIDYSTRPNPDKSELGQQRLMSYRDMPTGTGDPDKATAAIQEQKAQVKERLEREKQQIEEIKRESEQRTTDKKLHKQRIDMLAEVVRYLEIEEAISKARKQSMENDYVVCAFMVAGDKKEKRIMVGSLQDVRDEEIKRGSQIAVHTFAEFRDGRDRWAEEDGEEQPGAPEVNTPTGDAQEVTEIDEPEPEAEEDIDFDEDDLDEAIPY